MPHAHVHTYVQEKLSLLYQNELLALASAHGVFPQDESEPLPVEGEQHVHPCIATRALMYARALACPCPCMPTSMLNYMRLDLPTCTPADCLTGSSWFYGTLAAHA